ncbi:MAG: sugar O-acyltransferase, sialic acid O-acetyltransferase NeuD family [Candidatus Electronema aureum]|uniref:Sugar O-acyltransferase, sialic acid O-acetyltransferase NeuD family n=1 Tax=Candidatus Electronema aureum TaxID=2005002 RepID=A0A521FZT2_9BACT|nr:MAG: sugar O-acyltransferase, sialic acid O-acetyltransferase NeuD family [Candidatus Electronema aureum]
MEAILLIENVMKKLIIIGAGGFGREVLCWALDCQTVQNDWRVYGFLDENLRALQGFDCPCQLVGYPSSYIPAQDEVFICAIGDPRIKLSICEIFMSRGAQFINLIHPTALIGLNNKIGQGCIFCPRSAITTNVTLGDFVTINAYSGIGHDAVLGKGVTLSAYCDVTGNAVLGEGVFLGSHAVVLPSAKVGDYAIVGAGSVVLKTVKAGVTVMGVPAKQVAGF